MVLGWRWFGCGGLCFGVVGWGGGGWGVYCLGGSEVGGYWVLFRSELYWYWGVVGGGGVFGEMFMVVV